MALGRSAELVKTTKAWGSTTTIAQVVQLDSGEVDCQGVTRRVVVSHQRHLLERKQERHVHYARPGVADDRGEPVNVKTTGSGPAIREERRAASAIRPEKSVPCGRDNLGSTDNSCVGSCSALRSGQANRRRAQVPCSLAGALSCRRITERAGAEMRSAASLALSLARCWG